MDKKNLEEKLSLVALEEELLNKEETSLLESDPELAAFLADSKEIIKDLKELNLKDPGEIFFKRQSKQIQAALPSQGGLRFNFHWSWMAAAAVLLLSLGIFRYYSQQQEVQLSQQEKLERLELLLVEFSPQEEEEFFNVAPLATSEEYSVENLNEEELEIFIKVLKGKTRNEILQS